MLIRRLLSSWLRQARHAAAAPTAAVPQAVESLPGFNKLVRGRHGVFIANENDLYIGRALIQYGEFSEREWKLLRNYSRPGGIVAEVGANIGAHTVSLAQAVGADGRVCAVEPQPVLFQSLCANLALNCLLNVDAHNCGCGIGARDRSVPLIDYSAEGNFGGIDLREPDAGGSVRVPMRPLDELVERYPRVDLLKIDVEGMEKDVIASAARTIQKFRPVMYVENDRRENQAELISAIAALDYRMWWHLPLLYNPVNYFENALDLYPGVCSINMLCIHRSVSDPGAVQGMQEVVDPQQDPVKAQNQFAGG